MNTINPQGVSIDAQRTGTQGGKRTESSAQNTRLEDVVELKESDQPSQLDSAKVAEQDVVKAVAQLNDYIQSVQRDLQFRLDDQSGQAVISVVDRTSLEVIRQIPAELTLSLAEKLNNQEPLLLFSAQV